MQLLLAQKTQAAINAYTAKQTDESEMLWQDAVSFANQHNLIAPLTREAVDFGDKQSLYGDFEKANEKYELAIRMSKKQSSLSQTMLADLFSKVAANQANYDEELSVSNFEIAVFQFESDDYRDELAYADCLNQYGRALRRLNKFSESIDVQEKALEAYLKVSLPGSAELQNRVRGLREHLDNTGDLAEGPQREELRCRAARILGYPEPTPEPSLEEALAILHEEGLDIAFSLEEAQRLTQGRNPKDWQGCHLLEEALRERFEAEEYWDDRPHDSIIVYPMPFGIDELQECFDYFCERAGLESGFNVIDGDEQFEPLTVQTPNGEVITFEYKEVSELVELVDKRLEEIGDNRRFFRLDGHEYEGVYYLLPIDTKERLAQRGVLEFFHD